MNVYNKGIYIPKSLPCGNIKRTVTIRGVHLMFLSKQQDITKIVIMLKANSWTIKSFARPYNFL